MEGGPRSGSLRKTATLAASCSLTQREGEQDEKGDRVRDRLREGEKKKGGSETENVKIRESEKV